MSFDPANAAAFRYDGFEIDAARGRLTGHYSIDGWHFREVITVGSDGDWSRPAVLVAARWLYLLAGVSYYKAAAPPVIDFGDIALTGTEAAVLRSYFVEGLGEYAYRNGLDLRAVELRAATRAPEPVALPAASGRPLIPFGGGIDSIVTVEQVRERAEDPALFVVSMGGERFEAIEGAAAVTGLPVVRAEREIDPKIREARRLDMNFRNGHVPVTAIISAVAVLAAVLEERDAVVMSNEWSASVGNVVVDGLAINHQFSKSLAFEEAFRAVLDESFGAGFEYFSFLRPFTELWVAREFAFLTKYHDTFRSCNRAFHIDRSLRLDHWCGVCDKCCFIDLILAPFLDASALQAIFAGREPLNDPERAEQFRTLVGVSPNLKPFECVGDEHECRIAARAAATREDRAEAVLLQGLATAAEQVDQPAKATGEAVAALLRPVGPHHVPERYAPPDLLV